MKTDPPKDIEKVFREGTAIDRALRAAAREAIRRHKQAGVPVAMWKNGQTVWVKAEVLEQRRRTKKK